jgi:hypothetical protein
LTLEAGGIEQAQVDIHEIQDPSCVIEGRPRLGVDG